MALWTNQTSLQNNASNKSQQRDSTSNSLCCNVSQVKRGSATSGDILSRKLTTEPAGASGPSALPPSWANVRADAHSAPLGPDAGLYPVGSQVQLISQLAAPTVISPGPVCLELDRNGKNMMPPRLRPPPPMRAPLAQSHMWSDRTTALQHIKAHIMTMMRERWDGCMRHYCSTETSLFPSHSTENVWIFIWMQLT